MLTAQQASELKAGDTVIFRTGIGPYEISGKAKVAKPKEKGESRRLIRCAIVSFLKQGPSSRHKVGDEESFLTDELSLPEVSTS